METGLIFMKRTPKEIEIFGGEVYIDINGKNITVLDDLNIEMPLTEGIYKLKMYKTHTYDTVIGIAEVDINIKNGEKLFVKYSSPMLVNQPGNITVKDYTYETNIDDLINNKNDKITEEFNDKKRKVQEQEQKNNNMIIITIVVVIVCAIIWGIQMSEITNY